MGCGLSGIGESLGARKAKRTDTGMLQQFLFVLGVRVYGSGVPLSGLIQGFGVVEIHSRVSLEEC